MALVNLKRRQPDCAGTPPPCGVYVRPEQQRLQTHQLLRLPTHWPETVAAEVAASATMSSWLFQQLAQVIGRTRYIRGVLTSNCAGDWNQFNTSGGGISGCRWTRCGDRGVQAATDSGMARMLRLRALQQDLEQARVRPQVCSHTFDLDCSVSV
jgi:hypothetical protein